MVFFFPAIPVIMAVVIDYGLGLVNGEPLHSATDAAALAAALHRRAIAARAGARGDPARQRALESPQPHDSARIPGEIARIIACVA